MQGFGTDDGLAAPDLSWVLESTSDVVWVHRPDGVLDWVSPSITRLLGYLPQDLVGTRTSIVVAEDREGALSALAAAVEQHLTHVRTHVRVAAADERILWVDSSIDLWWSPEGELLRTITSMRDVTDERLASDRLTESEAMYRRLAANSTDVVLLAVDGVMRWLSPSLTHALGYLPEDWEGRRFEEFTHPDDIELAQQRRREIQGGAEALTRLRMRDARGDWHWIDVHAGPADDEQGGHPGIVATIRVVDELVTAESSLREAESRFRAMVDSLLDPHVLLSPVREGDAIVDFLFVEANPAALAYWGGLTRDAVLGRRFREVFTSDAGALMVSQYAHTLSTGEPLVLDDYTYPNELAGGIPLHYDIRGVRMGDQVSLTWRDVTSANKVAHLLNEAIGSSTDAQALQEAVRDPSGRVVDFRFLEVNEALCDHLGRPRDAVIGRLLTEVQPETDPERIALYARVVDTGEALAWDDVEFDSYADRARRVVDFRCHRVGDGILIVLRDATERHRMAQELERRARTDALTGLLTRREGWRRLAVDLDERRHGQEVAALFIDLDGFKAVNDARGHQVGDALLIALADRLQGAMRDDDYVVRVGGDELLVVLNGVDGLDAALQVAERIRATIALPVSIDDVPVAVTASVGATLAHDGDSVAEIVHRADRAMYAAKSTGRDQVVPID